MESCEGVPSRPQPLRDAAADHRADGTDAAPGPTLSVEDMQAAVQHYCEVWGFRSEPADDASGDVVVSLHGARIRLRQGRHGERAGRQVSPHSPHARIDVACPYRLHRHLDDRGCDTLDYVERDGRTVYRVMDPFRNVLEIGHRPGLGPSLARVGVPPVTDRVLVAWRNSRNDRAERPHLDRFAEFYRGLPDKDRIFYMFFLGPGLLHWVTKAASFVPPDVNLVLFASALPPDEQRWARELTGRPLFHMDLPVDDKTVWKFLLETNERNFGWLDIDCLVTNPALFSEMSDVSPDVAVNATWWYDSGFGVPLAATYFQFVNVEAQRALRRARLAIDPTLYAHVPFNIDVPGRRYYARRLTRRIRRQLTDVVPVDERGRCYLPGPTRPGSGGVLYYDTTAVWQLAAHTLGFTAGRVRSLRRRGLGGTGPDFEQLCDEVVHIGGVSYDNRVSELHSSPDTKLRYLLADHVALLEAETRLPAPYGERHRSVLSRLSAHGFGAEAATAAAVRHLVEERGLRQDAANRVVAPPADPR